MKKLFATIMFVSLALLGFSQGVTSSSINGKITDKNGEPLIGANVAVLHLPSGTLYGNSTDFDGYYRIPNMKVGGPYKVTVSYTGYEDFIKENVFLRLGQSFKISTALSESAIELGAVEVIAAKGVFDGNKTGAQTTISEEQMNVVPTLSRAIGDFARLSPQASIEEGQDGLEISLGGMNSRYNAIYVDGAVSNDVFGLARSGTNGGQTGVSPFSMDAIEEFQISLAPFDVREGGFAGGAINAITRSGSNNLEGSIYSYFRNQNFAGKTPTDDPNAERIKLDDYTAGTYGFRLGGPLIRNKLFFFVNAELQRDETPLPFDFNTYKGNGSRNSIDSLVNKLRNDYGYDPGGFENNRAFLNSEKITVKLDWNINAANKLTLRHSYVDARNLERTQSSPYNIRFQNGAEYFKSNTNTSSVEFNTLFSNSLSNNLLIGYTRVRDDRDPYNDPFPRVEIDDGDATIHFGSEPYSTANILDQDVLTITDNLSIYKGRHNITFGTHNEFYKIHNLFLAFNYGWYYYDDANRNNLSAFINGENSNSFRIVHSQVDNKFGDESGAAADFNSGQLGFYVQDEYNVSDNFKVTGGVRFDIPFFGDTPVNQGFNDTTLAKLAVHYDMKGAKTGDFIKTQVMISPRLGFNWDVTGKQETQIRGGVGVFTSRVPLVWVGGAYNNYGFNTGYYSKHNQPFEPDVNKQLPENYVDPANPNPSGDIDLYANDFKLPQFLKANLILDQKLPLGLIANIDLMYNKTLQNVAYKNVNQAPSTKNLTGSGDNRPIYNRYDKLEGTYSFIMLGYNVNQGYSYNLSASLTLPQTNGISAGLAYSYGDSYSVFEGTSSQNKSQWRYHFTVNGRNAEEALRRSQFAAGHRIMANLGYSLDWNEAKNASTTISLFFEGKSGGHYSYTYFDRGKLNNETKKDFQLIYVPKDRNDINLIDDGDRTADQQWTELNAFIEADPYLSTIRGKYADRNQSTSPWTNIIDMKILQDFSLNFGGKKHTFQASLDVFNLGNLINKDWGRRYGYPGNFRLINFKGFEADGTTPKFTFSADKDYDTLQKDFIIDSGLQSSRWQMQLGLRYIFK